MNHRQRISRRVMRHFLQLAAASFAIGVNAAPASAGADDAQIGDLKEDSRYTQQQTPQTGQDAYPLTFTLPPSEGPLAEDSGVAIRVLDSDGRKLVQMHINGASMVGPLDHGAYTLLIKAAGLTEVHRLRIGTDTLPYLHFTEAALIDPNLADNDA